MAKLTEYSEAYRFDTGDILIKDGTNGTKKIKASNAAADFAGMVSGVNHRNVYRGKNLGTSITDAQKAAISSGTFDNIFIGDYWTLNEVRYDVADMDYWYNTGDTAFTKHHLVIVPHNALYTGSMNATNTTDGGYTGSQMYTEGLSQAKSTIQEAFGDMLLRHREYLINAVTDGHPSAIAWFDSTVELMNEIMVYGCHVHASTSDGSNGIFAKSTVDKQQLSIFRLNPKDINIKQAIWLRDIVSSSYFAVVASMGHAHYNAASSTSGVRPVFAIG